MFVVSYSSYVRRNKKYMLYIASDHGGFQLKEFIKANLLQAGGRVVDLGPDNLVPDDDYPDYAKKVATRVSKNPPSSSPSGRGQGEGDFGILICRSGQGMCIAANKFKGVRAALAWSVQTAKASRNDDHANILCLPSDHIKPALAQKIVQAWLDTPWSPDKRHVRRVAKVGKLGK